MKNQISFSNEGRTITTKDPGLTWLARGLHKRLEHYGDIKGVSGVAKVCISVVDGDLVIEVDQDCNYEGYHNWYKGTLTKRACEKALKSMLLSDLMWTSIPRKPPENGIVVYDLTGELKKFYPTARQVGPREAAGLHREYDELWDSINALPASEKKEIHRFLD